MIQCPTCRDSFESVEEYTDHVLTMQKPIEKKSNSDYETALFRDFMKSLGPILIGLLIGVSIFCMLFVPFHGQVIGQHCMESTDYTIPSWILRSLTIQC